MFSSKLISTHAFIVVTILIITRIIVTHAQIGSVVPSCDGGAEALGMGSYFIEDSQLDAYHSYTVGPVENGRIVSDTSIYWSGKTSSSSKWYEVDLLAHTVITGLSIEGRMDDGETEKRILTYSIQYSSDGVTFIDYEDDGGTVIFDGVTVEGTTVDETFDKAIVARTIRIIPVTYENKPTMRLELYGCYQERSCLQWAYLDADYQALVGYFWSSGSRALQYYADKYNPISVCYYDDINDNFWDCTSPLGVGNGYIDDSQMTASSYTGSYYPWNARYDMSGVWIPNNNADSEWLLIDFTADTFISGFNTRGDSSSSSQVDEFYVTYSTDNVNFDAQTEFAEPQTVDTLYLYQVPMTARYLKFSPDSWTDNIALAVEVYGCGSHVPTAFPTQEAATTASYTIYPDCDGMEGYYYIDEDGDGNAVYTYCTRISEQIYDTCFEALGMEDGTILKTQITTSSISAARFGGNRGRVNVEAGGNSWKPDTDDTNQWIMVDLGTDRIPLVTGVGTQSRGNDQQEWVASLKISHSIEGSTLTTIQDNNGDKIFAGNSEYGTVKQIFFETAVHARFVRFEPQTWYGAIAMRVEVYGCRDSIIDAEATMDNANITYGWYYTSGTTWDFKTTVDGVYTNAADLSSVSGFEMTASSEKGSSRAEDGTLNNNDCWTPSNNDASEWLQFDFSAAAVVTKIEIQGHDSSANKYVETYYILHAMNVDSFTTYQHGGEDHLIIGNDGSGVDVIASEIFNPPIVARYIRISPQSWGSAIGLRAAIYGVQHSATCLEWEADLYDSSPDDGYYYYTGLADLIYCPMTTLSSYATCQDYHDAGFTDDNYYYLDPASGGVLSDAVFAYCDFTTVPNNDVAMITVSNDLGGWTYLESYIGNYSESVTYGSTAAANVGSLASASAYCYQYLMYECYESILYAGGRAVSWWTDKDENPMPYWAGNEAESKACSCNDGGTCSKSSNLCHCDMKKRYSEGGWITDKSSLPVGGLYFGDVSDAESEGNFSLGDLVCFTKDGSLPSSCYDVKEDGYSTNGVYLLKLSNEDYIPVYCDFNSVENAIVTIFGHDFEEAFEATDYQREGRYARDINYDYAATVRKTGNLVDEEDACRQRIEYSCTNGAVVDPGVYSWLAIRNGSKTHAWAGSSVDNMCTCGVLGSCFDSTQNCNCDGVQTTVHEDNGWVTDRSKLPLKQIRLGGVPLGKSATIKVGKLECFKEDSGSTPPVSCYEIKDNGASAAGDYLIDPDGPGGEEPFIVYCDPGFNSTHAQMIIHHDSESRTHVVGKATAGEYQKMVTYDGVTIDQFTALFSNDIYVHFISCVQSFLYECYASTLIKNDMSWFVDRIGASRTNFGVANESISSCACGVDGSCSSASELCNCDADAISWAEDSGDINDFNSTFLPVTQLRFGDTAGGEGNEEGYHTLGPLICSVGPRPPICIRDDPCLHGGSCSGDSFGTDDFTCDCTGTGYEGSICDTDYDECANDDHSCDAVSEECVNTVGSYTCACADGFVDNSGTCEDIDECSDNIDDCLSSLATCVNIPGNYTCDCDSGYEGDGRNNGNGCSNIDECSDGTDTCHYRASCTDSVGSYTCACNAGYTGDGESCSDLNECNENLDNCLSGLSQCQNAIGTFSCACVNGYEGDGVNNCTDIDECTEGTDACHNNAQCNNTIGAYTCTCDSGYTGSGYTCSDVDECTDGLHNCLNVTGNCTNTEGSFECTCDSGYHGDGITYCNDTNECIEGTHNCHPSLANCTNTIGDFICACFPGYSGNGVRCLEIDECVDYNVTCSGVGVCVDLVDDYICDCEYGYWDKDCDKDAAYLYTSNYFDGALYWSFDTFNETGDGSYPNQNVNMSMYNAFPGLAVQQNYSISGNSIMTRFNGTNDCIDFGDFSGSCYSDPSLCTDGFSVSFWMRLTEDEIKESGPVYITSSGMPDARGFGIYRESRKITVQVNDGSTTFTVELNNLIPADLWKNLGFAWSSSVGLSVFLDRARVGTDRSGTSTGLSDVLNTLALGCRYNGASYTAHSTGMFDELLILPTWVNTTNELIWLMGGWDEDNCVIDPCDQGDCYDTGMAAYRCDCFPGYNETHCDTEIDECEVFPCLNGGTCTDWIAYYTCECAFGYTGYSCEKDLSPNYDYSNVKSLKAQFLLITPEINPYYATIADHYFPLNNLGELDIQGANISVAFGRADLGLYPSIDGSGTFIEMGNFTNGCLSDPSLCPYGFTFGFWFLMNEKSPQMNEGMIFSTAGPVNGQRVGINIELSRKKDISIEVCDGTTLSTVVISKGDLTFKNWLHLGVSWSADHGLIVYLGGKTHPTAATTQSCANADNTYDTMTLGSQFESKGSAESIVFNDLVIWGRAIKPYERHMLFGMTRREFAMIETTDHYWTCDGYVRRDWTTLADYMPEYAANIHPMDRAGEADVILGHGRDDKGQSVMVLGDGDGWLFFGDFAGTCISNTHKCSDGLSVSTWVRLSQIADNETHFLVSSGEQVTRGFSIYQRDADRLGAAVTDGYTRWVTEIVHVPFIQYEDNMTVTDAPAFDFMGEWTNVGLTWTKTEGLFFYLNGRVVARDPTGYQKFRPNDFETVLIFGRRNDFLGHASNVSFDEMAIAERKMEPYDYRDTFAKMDNFGYEDAQYNWQTLDLISGNMPYLSTHSLPQGFIFNGTAYPRVGYVGPTPNVTLEDDLTVNLPGYPNYISLGDFTESFVTRPAGKGLSVSFWAKLHFDVAASQNDVSNGIVNQPSENDTTTMPPPTTPSSPVEKQYLVSSGGEGSTKGFNVFLEGNGLNFVVDDGNMMSWKRIDTAEITSDTWTNIAFTWHRRESFIIYINGKEATPIGTIVNVSSCCQRNETHFTIGRGTKEDSGYAAFKLHNLVIWEKYIHPRHVYKLLGVTDIEKYYMDMSDYYWPFDMPAEYPYPVLAFEAGARLTGDRHHFGRSAYTDGKNDYVRLYQFGAQHCVTDPSRCVNGLALGMWVMLRDIPSGSKCLLTSGADVSDERGIAIIQRPDDLEIIVNDGQHTWTVKKVLDKGHFGVWLYLAFRWQRQGGLTVLINGQDEGEKISGVDDVRNGLKQTELLLGRCSYRASSNGYLEAHYDDVVIMLPTSDQSQPDASQLHGDPICTGYVTPDLYYNFTSPESTVSLYDTKPVKRETKYGGDKRGVSLYAKDDSRGLVDIGDFRRGCLSSPSGCSKGVTISFWMKLLNIDNLDDPVTNPRRRAYILSSGAQDINSTGFAIYTNNVTTTVEVRTEHRVWKNHYLLWFVDEWTNIALTWGRRDGLSFFVNGELQYDYELPTTVSTWNSTYNATTTGPPTTTPIPTTTEGPTTIVTTQPATTEGNVTNGTTPVNVTNYFTTDHTTTPFVPAETTIEVTTTPIWTTPYRWSPRENDTYSHLVLGARNDLNEGYTRAEFADLAVWYEVIDMMNPRLSKMVMGQECHEIVITDNHEELAGYEVWTGTIECDDRHLADCTENLDSFFEVISKASFEDPVVYEIAKVRLRNYTDTSAYMTVDEIKMTTVLLEKALTRTLPETMLPEEALSDMEDLIAVTSNLFNEDRQRRWTTIHQARRRRGTYSTDTALGLASKLEDYLMSMAEIVEGVNGTYTDVNMTIVTDNIIVHVDRYRSDDVVPGTIYQFPYYDNLVFETTDQSTNESSSDPWSGATDQITLPQNVYDYIPAKRDNKGDIVMVGILFNTLDQILPVVSSEDTLYKESMQVDSRIMYLRIEPPLRKSLYNKIVMQFEHKKSLSSKDQPFCVFWDFDIPYTKEGAWSMRGCTLEETNETHTTCHCDHLTHFAIMTQDRDPVVVSIHDKYLRYITWGGIAVSLIALMFLLLIFISVADLHTIRNCIHINMILSMVFAKITYIVVDFLDPNSIDWISCKAIACVMQYFYVGVFSWMMVQGAHLLVEVVNPKNIPYKQKFRYYFLVAWGTPFMIVGVSFAKAHEGYGTTDECWLTMENNALWIFLGTSLSIIFINMIIIMIVYCCTSRAAKRSDPLKTRKSSLRATAIMLPLLGITWSLSIVEVKYGLIELTYLFATFHALQGLFIAIFYGVCNPEVRLAFMGADLEVEFSKVQEVSITPEPEDIELEPLPKPSYKA